MPITDTYDESFKFNSQSDGPIDIEVEYELVSADAHALIKNANAKNEPGSMELMAVVGAVKNLRIDGQIYKFSGGKQFPRHYDIEADQTLLERLCQSIVRHEPYLATRYRNVFERYLDETNEPKRINPTPFQPATKEQAS